MPQLEIHVQGTGSAFRVAERAMVRLSISATSTNQTEAFEAAQSTVSWLMAHIRSLASKTEDGLPHPSAAVTAFTVSPLSTSSFYPRDKNHREMTEQPRRHTVSSSAEIIFRDYAQLARTSAELAQKPHISVTETEWRLTEPSRLELGREARVKAVRDAVQKANDYAGVVGRRVVAVEIKDGSHGHYGGHPVQQMALQQYQQQMQRPAQGASNEAAVVSSGPALEPKTITASASVMAKFVSVDGGENGDDMEVVR